MLYQQQGLDMEAPERGVANIDPAKHLAGVPRYLFRTALATAAHAIVDRLRGRELEAFEHELWLCMFAGIVRQRWHDRRQGPVPVASPQARTAA
jgi:hypothetical protein